MDTLPDLAPFVKNEIIRRSVDYNILKLDVKAHNKIEATIEYSSEMHDKIQLLLQEIVLIATDKKLVFTKPIRIL
jgi:hypothetical protein